MDVQEIRKQLRRIEGDDPSAIREQVVDILFRACGAKLGLFLKSTFHKGMAHWSAITPIGDREAREKILATEGQPHLSGGLWNPWEPRRSEQDQFVSLDHGPVTREQLQPAESYQRFYRPFGIHDHARALLYDGRRFIGWFGVLREEGVPFSLEDLERINHLVEAFKAPLIAAENMDGVWRDSQVQLVLEPQSLRVEYASRNGERWLNARRRELLERLLRQFERGEDRARSILDGFEVQVVELVGAQGGTRYHVNVTSSELPRMGPDALLTPRQREVAGFAVVGATNQEIAETLGLSQETVKQHLKNVYTRLEISGRIELAALISDSQNPRF